MIQSFLWHVRLKQFLKRRIAEADRSLTAFIAGDARSQQTFVLMKTSFVFVFRRRLDQDEYVRLSLTSSEDVFKTSWSRPVYSSWPYVFKTSSRRFAKTSSRRLAKRSSRHLQDVFKTFSRRPQNVFKTSSRRLQDVSSS